MYIRLATTDDYEQIAKIRNIMVPDFHVTSEKLTEDDKMRDKKIKFCRWVAEIDDIVVGEGLYSQNILSYHPNKFVIEAYVLPEYQNRGIGSVLYEVVTKSLEQYDPIHYLVLAQENLPEGIKFLSKKGFSEISRDRIAHLDVKSFNINKFVDLEKKFRADGIVFKKLKEISDDSDYAHKLYELELELINDIPGLTDPLVKQTYDEWLKNSFNHQESIHDAYHVAVKNGEYIGYSYLWGGSNKNLIHNGMTGVKRQYRGSGIALMLKFLGVKYAKENGYSILWTSNSVINTGILGINKKLGYETQYETVEMLKTLREG